ncbi:MAG TPA: lysylphosphatidylglycerol synthase domain-containing protein [Gemmatimonadales bacterium]|nr:lysylphosphatidylglycerol synthase domain-containing protein [Gemmatimonadales bacterium]
MRKPSWRTIQLVLLGVAALALAWKIQREWDTVRASPAAFELHADWLVVSLLATWLMYAALVEGWRRLVIGWGHRLPWLRAARIWILSSIAAFIPGRIWGFAGMAIMSERAGVRGTAAVAAAVVMQVLAIGTGVGVAAIAMGPEIGAYRAGASLALTVLGVIAIGSTVALGNQRFLDWLWRLARRESAAPSAPRWPALLESALINLLAWLGYGVAFWALARGILPDAQLPLRVAVGTYAVSYIAGYLAVFTPGGLGVRELFLVGLLTPSLGAEAAIALSLGSRLVIMLNQAGAAAPFFILRESASDGT